MRRIHFTSPDLAGFVSAAPDDHIKLFVPGAPSDDQPVMRDYTPRAFDVAAGTLAIDFYLHQAGPATEWALRAQAGDTLEIGGPRGSTLIADDFDWYLLIGDETALPAICRRVEERRGPAPVLAVLVVEDPAEAGYARGDLQWASTWLVRDPGQDEAAAIIAALRDLALPAGDGFIWIAAEAGVARAVRAHVLGELGHPPKWVKAAGYWTRGLADAHGAIED